ncbi:hypothetical protein ABU549_004432 [Yersinia enterocolitica]|uniref:hypothetical protein n=1 Tax=Yersinia enterocolitica TaxID=630 RepID=UPI00313EC1E0
MLSKEQLEKIANPGPVDVGGAQNPIVTEMAIELLSLREQREAERQRADTLQTERDEFRRRLKLERSILEDTEKQLAELKTLEPVAEMRTWPKNISGPNPDWYWFGKQDFPVGTQLFTSAKPATTVVPEGHRFVPIKLTPTMRRQMHTIGDVTCHECGTRLSYDCTDNIEYSWADILEATPEVPNAK